jgi:flagellar P-ring protein precursor FlgI
MKKVCTQPLSPRRSPLADFRLVHLAIGIAAACCMLFFSASPARAERLKDLATIRGVTANTLVGYGLVVGLNGTGDNAQSVQTQQVMANMLSRRFGTVIRPQDIKAQNIAVVMVTARLPPFSRTGRRLDVVVSSSGNARSLYGGTLMPTALRAGNGAVFAWAEGPLTVGGFSASGSSGSSATKNHPTVGQIPNGGVVAKELNFRLDPNVPITLALKEPDFTTASRTAYAINQGIGAEVAHASDAGTISILVPKEQAQNLVGFLSTIENLDVTPDQSAKVVINERTGTVVMGTSVRISPAAISHGSITVQISEKPLVSQPNPFSEGDTLVVPDTQIDILEDQSQLRVIDPGPTLGEVVHTLNTLGVKPRDLVAILLALRRSGSLRAEIEVE